MDLTDRMLGRRYANVGARKLSVAAEQRTLNDRVNGNHGFSDPGADPRPLDPGVDLSSGGEGV